MTFSFACPHCGKEYQVDQNLAGRKAQCGCGNQIRIPARLDSEDLPAIEIDLENADLLGDLLPPSSKLFRAVTKTPEISPPTSLDPATGQSAPSSPSHSTPPAAPSHPKSKRWRKTQPRKASRSPPKSPSADRLPPNYVPQPTQPKRASRKKKKVRVPIVAVQRSTQTSRHYQEQYNDLDEILSADGFGDPDTFDSVPSREQQSIDHLLAAGASRTKEETENLPPSKTRSMVHFVSVLLSATLAFWFGLLIVLLRFIQSDQILLRAISNAMTGIYAGAFGSEPMTPFNQFGFAGLGWGLWVLGAAMLGLAMAQLANAFFGLIGRREILRWVDGVMATVSIVFVFFLVAALFLQSSHMTSLRRGLSETDPGAVRVHDSVVTTAEQVRKIYHDRNSEFTSILLVAGLIPLTVFACSIVHLFTVPRADRDGMDSH